MTDLDPEVIHLQGDDLDDVIGELQAAKAHGYARVMTQDHGVKVASGQRSWSYQYGMPQAAWERIIAGVNNSREV